MKPRNENFVPKSSYELPELIECGYGKLFGLQNAKLPINNMLMLNRIAEINSDGGEFGRGQIIAELDINPDLWFFDPPKRRTFGYSIPQSANIMVVGHEFELVLLVPSFYWGFSSPRFLLSSTSSRSLPVSKRFGTDSVHAKIYLHHLLDSNHHLLRRCFQAQKYGHISPNGTRIHVFHADLFD